MLWFIQCIKSVCGQGMNTLVDHDTLNPRAVDVLNCRAINLCELSRDVQNLLTPSEEIVIKYPFVHSMRYFSSALNTLKTATNISHAMLPFIPNQPNSIRVDMKNGSSVIIDVPHKYFSWAIIRILRCLIDIHRASAADLEPHSSLVWSNSGDLYQHMISDGRYAANIDLSATMIPPVLVGVRHKNQIGNLDSKLLPHSISTDSTGSSSRKSLELFPYSIYVDLSDKFEPILEFKPRQVDAVISDFFSSNTVGDSFNFRVNEISVIKMKSDCIGIDSEMLMDVHNADLTHVSLLNEKEFHWKVSAPVTNVQINYYVVLKTRFSSEFIVPLSRVDHKGKIYSGQPGQFIRFGFRKFGSNEEMMHLGKAQSHQSNPHHLQKTHGVIREFDKSTRDLGVALRAFEDIHWGIDVYMCKGNLIDTPHEPWFSYPPSVIGHKFIPYSKLLSGVVENTRDRPEGFDLPDLNNIDGLMKPMSVQLDDIPEFVITPINIEPHEGYWSDHVFSHYPPSKHNKLHVKARVCTMTGVVKELPSGHFKERVSSPDATKKDSESPWGNRILIRAYDGLYWYLCIYSMIFFFCVKIIYLLFYLFVTGRIWFD